MEEWGDILVLKPDRVTVKRLLPPGSKKNVYVSDELYEEAGTQTERDIDRDTERQRQEESERFIDRGTDRQRQRHRETERKIERNRQRERERNITT